MTKTSRDVIVAAALELARTEGIEAVTARKLGKKIGASSQPIFTWFDSMEHVKANVYEEARKIFRQYIEKGLASQVPFFGAGMQYIVFAREEPQLFKFLFLKRPSGVSGGLMESKQFMEDLVLESVMHIHNMSAEAARKYFSNMWLVSFSFATMIVTDNCPFSDEEIGRVMKEMSVSVCMGLKRIPGMVDGTFDRDAIFAELDKE
ncbi:MAG: TetR/AcrR family transcriptional regulator [Treponema sp.]|nr:TetR/AcrR family transcriptional regulator [Treponema sp.]